MSNYSSCILILTQLIGFEKNDKDEKATLPDQVEIDTLVQFKDILQDSYMENIFNDGSSSHEMKMVENNTTVDNESDLSFWSCNHCTFHNPINSNTCKICGLPRNVCANKCVYYFISMYMLCCIIFLNKTDSFFANGQ